MDHKGQMWRQCARWLCSLDILPANHKVMMPDASFQDLAYTLRDGVLLCHIASVINEASIDQKAVNHRPQMAQFLCLKNIKLFLAACKASFGLRDADLFEPGMLYDFTDFAQVLQTLSTFSNSAQVRSARPDVLPFSYGGPTEAEDEADFQEEDEEIYKKLEAEADEETYQEFYYKHNKGNYGYVWVNQEDDDDDEDSVRLRRRNYYYADEEKEEEIYADLGLARKPHQHHRSQSAAAQLQDWKFEPKEKRDYCLQELLETEANYVDVLNKLRKNFIRPITTISEADKKVIFMNIKELGDVHAAFFSALCKCVKERPLSLSGGNCYRRIGEVFMDFKEKFLKYGDYCSGLTKAQMTLESLCEENKSVAKEIERCESNANAKRILLRDMLVVPMQRILKYHLILHELIKSTPEAHEDFRSYSLAHEAMIDVAEYINEAKRDSELLHNIHVIQNSITALNMPDNTSLKDYGRLKKDGQLKVQSHEQGTGTKHSQRYIFLFDKLILMSKSMRGDDAYKHKESLRVADYEVQEVASTDVNHSSGEGMRAAGRRVMRRDSSRWIHAFLLVHTERLNAYTIYARTQEEKLNWMEAFREAHRNAHLGKDQGHELLLSSVDKATNCDVCHRLLKGLFYQGYKCTKCSRWVHYKCAGNLAFCGPLLEPPALPPRPTSMQLPTTVQNGDSLDDGRDSADELHDSRSSVQLNRQGSDTSNSSLVLAPPLASIPSSKTVFTSFQSHRENPDYMNTRMEDHTWYVGEMDRERANLRLSPFPPGAFLVRCGRLGYALSLKTERDVKHMKIDTQEKLPTSAEQDITNGGRKDNNNLTCFYFSENHKFNSIVELVVWYCNNSLKESFQGLDTVLKFPVGDLSIVKAAYEFNPSNDDAANLLALKAGDHVTVIDKLDDKGWWKAHNGNRIGYIPKTFVVELNNDTLCA